MSRSSAPPLLRPRHPRPLTPRGERTRAALVAAAREAFERDGYLDARLTDIVEAAGCSVGTFYLYFLHKGEVLVAVLEEAEADMLSAGRVPREERPEDPVERIEAANRAYFRAYRRHAQLMLLMEQVATLDPAFRHLRRRRGWTFTGRNTARITQLQHEGSADPTLDPVMTARALSGMVSRMAYYAYSFGNVGAEAADLDEALARTATDLWVNALGLRRS